MTDDLFIRGLRNKAAMVQYTITRQTYMACLYHVGLMEDGPIKTEAQELLALLPPNA